MAGETLFLGVSVKLLPQEINMPHEIQISILGPKVKFGHFSQMLYFHGVSKYFYVFCQLHIIFLSLS